ncbi:MAG TPA: 3-hydroxyacyl-CoA dehydrogenase family protein [Mycobacteriales bacterium]|nr:3-hydroxyacyl-CoA dehydrogenase family protein [Mycobacteriales bacterium]
MSERDSTGRHERAAIVGAGTMGVGFAQVLALGGIECRIADAAPELAVAARERAIALARRYVELDLMPAGAAETIADGVQPVDSVAEAVDSATLVLEAVPERPELKREVYGRIEAAAAADTVIATNTSAIPITSLSEGLRRPERFLGAHWFNPPQWVPAVELIPSAATDPAVVTDLAETLRGLGKRPTVVRDSAGFVANRIQFAMFAEAAAVVAEGVASAEDVDDIVRSSFGFRLPFFGPFAIADMAGLDVYQGAYEALREAHGEHFATPALVRELVEQGRVGHKAGAGILEPPEDIASHAERRDQAYAALARLLQA